MDRVQRAAPVEFEDDGEESDRWPDPIPDIVPTAPPLEDEEPDAAGAEGDDGTGQEEHQRGATGGVPKEKIMESVERKPAATQRREGSSW